MVRKQNILAFFKGKSFYLSLLIGVCAIFAVAVVYISIISNNKSNNLVDLNEPMDIASEQSENKVAGGGAITQAETETSDSAEVANNTSQSMHDAAQILNDNLLEHDIISEDELIKNDTRNLINQAASTDAAGTTAEVTDEATDESAVATLNAGQTAASSLIFDEEKGLLWPMNGNVIMNYSMDKVVYFQTLNQYKCNPAILIGGEVGTEVVCAAKGIVTEIIQSDETGTTVLMSIGNGYTLEYGQLKNLKVKVGDTVEEGAMIGNIAEPTNYYVVEGGNLYFKVVQNDETVNPLLLLR